MDNTSNEKSKSSSNFIEGKKKELTRLLDNLVEDPSITKEKKVKLIITATSLICALVAIQPIPFADIFILTPIQLVMVTFINKAIGNPLEKNKLDEILWYLLGIVGWGVLAQQLILGAYKTVIPFLGAFTTIPLVYAATYALGYAAKAVLEAKINNQQINDDELKKLINAEKEKAKSENKNLTKDDVIGQLSEIKSKAKEYEDYKNTLIEYEKKLDDEYKRLISEHENKTQDYNKQPNDISESYCRTREIIEKRYRENYKNVVLSEIVIHSITFLRYNESNEFETVISQINDNIESIKQNKITGGDNTYDINTSIGTVCLSLKQNKLYVQYVEFEERIKENLPLIEIDLIKSKHLSEQSKFLYNEQIRDTFINALKTAKKEIDIISPWVGENVINAINPIISKALENGVKINIVYGIQEGGSYDRNGKEDKTHENVERLREEYKDKSNFQLKKGNTHIKLFICDESFYLMGSYNFLSFGGHYNSNTRDELVEYSENIEKLRELRAEHFQWSK